MSSTIGSIRRVYCDFVAPSRIVSDTGQWNTIDSTIFYLYKWNSNLNSKKIS